MIQFLSIEFDENSTFVSQVSFNIITNKSVILVRTELHNIFHLIFSLKKKISFDVNHFPRHPKKNQNVFFSIGTTVCADGSENLTIKKHLAVRRLAPMGDFKGCSFFENKILNKLIIKNYTNIFILQLEEMYYKILENYPAFQNQAYEYEFRSLARESFLDE